MAPHVEEQLTLYVLGSLTAEEEAAVVGHVEGCVECAAALSRLKETV
ncbi:MAG: anti-sigma factor family protein, partial [Myxococcaceae bacterium]